MEIDNVFVDNLRQSIANITKEAVLKLHDKSEKGENLTK
jgi:hypothetical protein